MLSMTVIWIVNVSVFNGQVTFLSEGTLVHPSLSYSKWVTYYGFPKGFFLNIHRKQDFAKVGDIGIPWY